MLLVVLIFSDEKRNGGLGIYYEMGFNDIILVDFIKVVLVCDKV